MKQSTHWTILLVLFTASAVVSFFGSMLIETLVDHERRLDKVEDAVIREHPEYYMNYTDGLWSVEELKEAGTE